jgi:hypothetical protein
LISIASSHPETDKRTSLSILSLSKGRRASTLVAALALVFLIMAVTTLCLARIASIYAESGRQRGQTSAVYLAEAGIQKAADALSHDPSYAGESGVRLPTGSFDVKVARSGSGYAVTSTGIADSPLAKHPKRTVRATLIILSSSKGGGSFRVTDWRENQ